MDTANRYGATCARFTAAGGNDEVMPDLAYPYCGCHLSFFSDRSLGDDALDFMERMYHEDILSFVDQYPQGSAWFEISLQAESFCRIQVLGDW